MKTTDTKLVISGSIIEACCYPCRPLSYDFAVQGHDHPRTKIAITDEASRQRKIESRKRSMRRTASILRKLVNSNAWQYKTASGAPYTPIFVTLTFKEDIRDIERANTHFSNFIRRLNYAISKGGSRKYPLKYIAVIEFQDLNRDGVIHYHAVFFNLDPNKSSLLSGIWKLGFVDIKEIAHIDNIGTYLSKYMSSVSGDARLDDHKRYFSSKGLLKPIEVKEESKARSIVGSIPREYITKISEFDGYQGKTKKVQYNLNKDETLFDVVEGLNNMI